MVRPSSVSTLLTELSALVQPSHELHSTHLIWLEELDVGINGSEPFQCVKLLIGETFSLQILTMEWVRIPRKQRHHSIHSFAQVRVQRYDFGSVAHRGLATPSRERPV